ncbi:MAG: DUF445 family protein [Fusobacteriaceae bacterium]
MLNVLQGSIMGALAGYITNDFAIELLFEEKNFLGVKLGGVIVKTREDFEDKVSTLVQEEIINHNTLKDALLSKEFNKVINKIFGEYFQEKLPNSVVGMNIGEIKDFDDSVNNLEELFERDFSNNLDSVMSSTMQEISLDKIISQDQMQNLSAELFQILRETIQKNKVLKNYLEDTYNEVKGKKIGELIGKAPMRILSDRIPRISERVSNTLKSEYEGKIDTLIENIFHEIGITEKLSRFENDLKAKTIEEILGKNKTKILSDKIAEQLRKYILSSEGREAVEVISNQIVNYLSNQDVKILDILHPNVRYRFTEFMEKKLPDIIERIVIWIRKNDRRIEDAIESSIDEVIRENNSVKQFIFNAIRNNMGNVTKRFGLVGKIIQKVNESKNDSAIAGELSRQALTYLQENTLGQIVRESGLEGRTLAKYMYENIKENSNKISGDIIPLGEIKLSKILPEDMTSGIEKTLVSELKKIKDNYLYDSKFQITLEKFLKSEIEKLNEKQLQEVMTEDIFFDKIGEIAGKFESLLDEKKEVSIEFFTELGMKTMRGVSLNSVLAKENREEINEEISQKVTKNISKFLWSLERKPLTEYTNKLKDNYALNNNSTEFFISALISNLEILLDGNIKDIVQQNLKGMDNDELKEMMQEFMGKELAPLNTMGGILGSFVGAGATYLLPQQTYFSLTNILAYSAIGVVTNLLAIKGIFRPYDKSKILKILTLGKLEMGVIPNQKPIFAKSMAKFVEKELMNKKNLEKMAQEKEDTILATIIEKLSANNLKLIHENIDTESSKIYQFIIKCASEFIENNKEGISQLVVDEIRNKRISDFGIEKLEKDISTIKIKDIPEGKKYFTDEIESFLKSATPLSSFISEKEVKKLIVGKLSETCEELREKKITPDQIRKIVDQNLRELDNKFEKTIKEILGDIGLENSVDAFYEQFMDYDGIKLIANQKVQELFAKEINPNKKVGDLFDGKIINYLESNVERVSNTLFQKALQALRNNESSLKSYAVEEMRYHLKGAEDTSVSGKIFGFFKSVANSAVGGDDLVRSIVGRSIYKTERILQDSLGDIESILYDLIRDLKKTPLKTFDLGLNGDSISSIIEKIVDSWEVRNIAKTQAEKVLNSLFEVPLKNYTAPLEIKNTKDLIKLFEKDLNGLYEESCKVITDNMEQKLVIPVSSIVMEIVTHEVFDLQLGNLTKDITVEEVEIIGSKLYSLAVGSLTFEKTYKELVEELINKLGRKKATEIISTHILMRDLDKIIIETFINVESLAKIYSTNEKEMINFIHEFVNSLSPKTVNSALTVFIHPLLDTIMENIVNIFESLHVEDITEKEIIKMDNRKLHNMFESFAGKYFRKLEVYGVMGGFFAVIGLNYLIILGYIIHKTKSKKAINLN